MDTNKSSENIDNIAQSFFLVLIFCSLVSDFYIAFDNFLNNNYIKKKISYCKKVYKVIVGLTFNNYIKDKEGNIIINEKPVEVKPIIKSYNPFDDDDDISLILKNIKEIQEDNEINIVQEVNKIKEILEDNKINVEQEVNKIKEIQEDNKINVEKELNKIKEIQEDNEVNKRKKLKIKKKTLTK